MKDRFYKEREHISDKLPKYHTKILLGDFNAKVRGENTFKLTTGNESLCENNHNKAVRVVNFAIS
jgi:hypothetical protein